MGMENDHVIGGPSESTICPKKSWAGAVAGKPSSDWYHLKVRGASAMPKSSISASWSPLRGCESLARPTLFDSGRAPQVLLSVSPVTISKNGDLIAVEKRMVGLPGVAVIKIFQRSRSAHSITSETIVVEPMTRSLLKRTLLTSCEPPISISRQIARPRSSKSFAEAPNKAARIRPKLLNDGIRNDPRNRTRVVVNISQGFQAAFSPAPADQVLLFKSEPFKGGC
jgi:hypothetical protein